MGLSKNLRSVSSRGMGLQKLAIKELYETVTKPNSEGITPEDSLRSCSSLHDLSEEEIIEEFNQDTGCDWYVLLQEWYRKYYRLARLWQSKTIETILLDMLRSLNKSKQRRKYAQSAL